MRYLMIIQLLRVSETQLVFTVRKLRQTQVTNNKQYNSK